MSFFGQPFMQHALLAGSAIALASGLVGYFVVLRAQVFTGDALSHVAFTGALAALAAGVDPRIGLFAFTIAVALFMGLLGQRGRADDAIIGSIFAWILGLGVLFLTLYVSSQSAATGGTSVSVLFGSIFGLTARQALVAAIAGVGVVSVLVVIGRPLLFASIDESVAAARGTGSCSWHRFPGPRWSDLRTFSASRGRSVAARAFGRSCGDRSPPDEPALSRLLACGTAGGR
jgi:zinc/manganese transport system permease protein